MNSLESYIDFSGKGRFAYYIDQSVKHKISLVDPAGYAHQACHIIQKNAFTMPIKHVISFKRMLLRPRCVTKLRSCSVP